jgi:hypothetical protein
MKKVLFILAVTLGLVACSGGGTTEEKEVALETEVTATVTEVADTTAADVVSVTDSTVTDSTATE